MEEKTQSGVSRRDFLTGAGVAAAAALAVPSVLSMTGCSEVALASETGPASHNESEIYRDIFPVKTRVMPVVDEDTYLTKHGNIAFERREISDYEIVKTWDTDVLVVGLGISGICAVLSASTDGVTKVLGLEKETHPRMAFECIGAVNSKVQIENNNIVTDSYYLDLIMSKAEYRITYGPAKTFVKKSGEAVDWLCDRFDEGETGIKLSQRAKNQTTANDMSFSNTTGVKKGSPALYVIPDLTATAEKRSNVELHNSVPVVQLIREDGRVVGAYAKDSDGYIRVNAKKGVVLCTGGYDMNPQLMKAWVRSEDIAAITPWTPGPGATGDGHMMGLHIGASVDPLPHGVMNFGNGNPDAFILSTAFGSANNAGMWINEHGVRFGNEALGTIHYRANQIGAQAHGGRGVWAIFGSSIYPKESDKTTFYREEYMRKGYLFEADSIRELAEMIGVPADALEAEVEKYNGFVDAGVDDDFGKNMRSKKKIEGPKFYANKCNQSILTTVSGLTIDGNMRVLDYERDVIPGLYAAGNCSGNFFFSSYPRDIAGISVGRAVTFGYCAGQNVAKEA